MNDQNFKNMCLKVFLFLKMSKKNIMKSANFFCFCFICTKRRCSEIKTHLKVEIEDERGAP